MGVGDQLALEQVRALLRAALERGVDAAPLLPELRHLAADVAGARGKALRKQLQAADSAGKKSRVDAAAAVMAAVEAVAASVRPAHLTRLASFCGLPVGADEDVDQRAAAAKARGDLFFEDTAGLAPDESIPQTKKRKSASVGGEDPEAAAGVEAYARRALCELAGDGGPEGTSAGLPRRKANSKGTRHAAKAGKIAVTSGAGPVENGMEAPAARRPKRKHKAASEDA